MPLNPHFFAAAMASLGPWGRAPSLAVAVSGGADSLALCLLAEQWVRQHGGSLAALTVDHGLRPASAGEAAQVAAWLGALGISHHILRWEGEKPSANLQENARQARYGLMLARCREQGAEHLLLGHHLNDQAETFLLRLARGSGVDGLAGMSALSVRQGVRLVRPLLGFPKTELEEYLRTRGQDWLEDASNRSSRFARNRIRRSQGVLAAEGLTPERLAATAAAMARAREALERETSRFLAHGAVIYPEGCARLHREALRAAPEEIGLRALAALLAAIGGEERRPRLKALTRLYRHVLNEEARAVTLGGCLFYPSRRRREEGMVWVLREAKALPLPMTQRLPCLWDDRFLLSAPPGAIIPEGVMLGPLGAAGLKELRAALPGFTSDLPAAALCALPSLRGLEGLLAVPHIGYSLPGTDLPDIRVRFVPPGW